MTATDKIQLTEEKETLFIPLYGKALDAGITRTQPPASITWFDVDYPEVISLRKQFYSETNEYKMITSSITAQNWLETIPNDRPALIIAEGVFEYLSEEEVKTLLQRIEAVPLFKSVFVDQLPFGLRFIFGLLTLFSKYKNGMRLLRYDF